MKRLLLLVLCAQPLAAQTPVPARAADAQAQATLWAGVGLSAMTLPYGLGGNASLSLRRRDLSFRLGLNGASNIKSTVTSKAVSFSVGTHRKVGALHLELFAGPAMVWGDDGINEDGFAVGGEPYQTVGLITDLTALLGLGSRVRLGVGTWANVNAQRSTVGAGPRLQIRLH